MVIFNSYVKLPEGMLREMFTVFSGIGIFLGFSAFISHFKTWFALLKWMTLDDSSKKKGK